MSIVRTLIGNIKGPAGATGATGATGAAGANGTDGAAATISVGTVSTTAYGNPAEVTNSGTSSAAVFDFVIPQGQPGEEVTDMSGLTLGTMTTQTAQYPTPQIGDNGATLWGKAVKYFSDLRTAIGTKLNTANVVNNFTTTQSGYALDARAGKTLKDAISDLTAQILPSTITDLNTITYNSLYCINSPTPTNSPFNGTFQSYLWTVKANNSLVYQFMLRSSEDIGVLYVRRYINGTWNNWHSINEERTATYSCAYTIPAGGQVTLTGDDFGIPSTVYQGYRPFSIREYISGNLYALPRYISCKNAGNSNVMALTNVSNSSISGTASITIGYVPYVTTFS